VKLLSHENRWWRQQAQRLLIERQDMSVVPALEKIFTEHPDPRARLHALYTLEGLNALTAALVSRAMNDSHEGVRGQGLILAERYPQLLPLVLARLHDPSIQVVLQATLSAGEFAHTGIPAELAQVVETNGRDPWIQLAVLSSVQGSSPDLVEHLAKHDFFKEPQEWKAAFVEDFSFAIGKSNQTPEVQRLLNLLKHPTLDNAAWRLAVLKGFLKGEEKAGSPDPEFKELLKTAKTDSDDQVRASLSSIGRFYNGK
jgi:hypothetical protein